MITIGLDYIFNKMAYNASGTLHSIDNSIHDKIKDTFVDNFIHELTNYLDRYNTLYRLNQLPKDAKLEMNEVEDDYIECYYKDKRYDIPNDLINTSNDNHYIFLQLQEDGLYHFVPKN